MLTEFLKELDMSKYLKKKRESLMRKAPSLRNVIRGSLMKYYLSCGNPNCRCKKGQGHGPYYYLQVKTKGKNKMYYLPGSSSGKKAKKGIENYNNLWEILCKISDINIRLLIESNKKRKVYNGKKGRG